MLSCKICKIFKNTFFYRTPFYSDCFCVFWKSGENFSPQQFRKSHVDREQLYRELQCRRSRGNSSKLIKQYPQLFLLLSWALWNFELCYICAAFWIKRVNSCLKHCSKKMNKKLSQCFWKQVFLMHKKNPRKWNYEWNKFRAEDLHRTYCIDF